MKLDGDSTLAVHRRVIECIVFHMADYSLYMMRTRLHG